PTLLPRHQRWCTARTTPDRLALQQVLLRNGIRRIRSPYDRRIGNLRSVAETNAAIVPARGEESAAPHPKPCRKTRGWHRICCSGCALRSAALPSPYRNSQRRPTSWSSAFSNNRRGDFINCPAPTTPTSQRRRETKSTGIHPDLHLLNRILGS